MKIMNETFHSLSIPDTDRLYYYKDVLGLYLRIYEEGDISEDQTFYIYLNGQPYDIIDLIKD